MPTRFARCATIAAALHAALWVLPATASERITLDGPWTRVVEGEDPLEFGAPRTFEPSGGEVIYVREFTLEAEIPDSVAMLHFDGVVGQARVFLNEVELGSHGSYTPFWFDVTDALFEPGQLNTLVVIIDDTQDPTTVPYEDIPWINYSGIARSVYLKFSYQAAIVRSRLQYDFTDDQYSGVSGEIQVELFGNPGVSVDVFGAIFQGTQESLTLTTSTNEPTTVTIGPDRRASTTLQFTLDNPRLWSPEDPYLYFMWVTATVTGVGVDESLDRIGFRDIEVVDEDIRLNGKTILLKGVTRHDIYPDTGFVGSPEQMETDMINLKQMGVNYARLIHYPHHPRILDLADELGLLVSCEIPAWANFFDEEVRQKLYVMYEELIMRDMNHPSVILWISGNARAHPLPYAKEAQQIVRSLDRNRLGSYVIDNDEYYEEVIQQDVDFVQEADLDVYMKVTFWLYYLEFLQDAWTNFPKDLPIIIAEIGFEGNDDEPVIITANGDTFEVSEQVQASTLTEMLEGWRPHLPFYSEEHISGLAIFNFQDLQWPNIVRFLPNHIPSLHFGLYYEDREAKEAVEAVKAFYTSLPTDFVGGLGEGNVAGIEETFLDPQPLGDDVNTINRDQSPSLTTSGNRLIFATDGPEYVGLPKLVHSDLVNGEWTEPQFLDIPQEEDFFAFRRSPCISYDERTLYFTRALVSGIFVAQTRIWKSDWVNGRWDDPVDLGDVINYPDALTVTSDPSVTADGATLYFSSNRPGGFGGTDLWVTQRIDGEWQFPANLGAAVNSADNDAEPAISSDGRTLYFTSGRPGGFGSSDIWVTHRVDGEWTEPLNLGPAVNTTGSEREPEVSKDGNFLFFTGLRPGGAGLSDLWFARVSGAPDPSDTSVARTVSVTTNNPGVVVVVTPSDVQQHTDGTADPTLERRFRDGTPVNLMVATTYNGLSFNRWRLDGVEQPAGENELSFTIQADVVAEAEYTVPESATIIGEDVLVLEGRRPSQSTATYMVSLTLSDAATRTLRAGVEWSVDNEDVATIHPVSGVLTPQPMDGEAEVTIFADVNMAGFDLPTASKTVRLEGLVIDPADDSGGGPAGGGGGGFAAPCGALGMVSLMLLTVGRFVLGFVPLNRRDYSSPS